MKHAFCIFFLLLFAHLYSQEVNIPQNYNLEDRLCLYWWKPWLEVKDTLRLGDEVLLLADSPLSLLDDLIEEKILPEMEPIWVSTSCFKVAPRYRNRSFAASWVIHDGQLYLQSIVPLYEKQKKQLKLEFVDADSVEFHRKDPETSFVYSDSGNIQIFKDRAMTREDVPSNEIIRNRIEKLSGERFENGLLKASWVNDTIIAAGDFHFDTGALYKDEYAFVYKNGKEVYSQLISLRKRKYDNNKELEQYLSQKANWKTIQKAAVVWGNFRIDKAGKVVSWEPEVFQNPFNGEKPVSAQLDSKFVFSIL